jgi:hypothetical protein
VTEHHSSRRARQLRKDSERQQRRRDALKAKRAPTTHTINRAIAEGYLYLLDAELAKGAPFKLAKLTAADVLVYAMQVLTRGTNAADSYDFDSVTKALRARVKRTGPSKFRLEPNRRTSDG